MSGGRGQPIVCRPRLEDGAPEDGEDPASARVVLVGELPGDKEDLEGRPFIDPKGALLRSPDRAQRQDCRF